MIMKIPKGMSLVRGYPQRYVNGKKLDKPIWIKPRLRKLPKKT